MLTNNYKTKEVAYKLLSITKTVTTITHMWSVPEEVPVQHKFITLINNNLNQNIFYDLSTIYKSDWKVIYKVLMTAKKKIIFYKDETNYLIIENKKVIKDKSLTPIDFIKRMLYSINNPTDNSITCEELWFKQYLVQTNRGASYNVYARQFKSHRQIYNKTRFQKNLEIITDQLDLVDAELRPNDYYNEERDYITYKKNTLTPKQMFFYRLQLAFYFKDSMDMDLIHLFADEHKAQTFIYACKRILNITFTLPQICREPDDIEELIISPQIIDYVNQLNTV